MKGGKLDREIFFAGLIRGKILTCVSQHNSLLDNNVYFNDQMQKNDNGTIILDEAFRLSQPITFPTAKLHSSSEYSTPTGVIKGASSTDLCAMHSDLQSGNHILAEVTREKCEFYLKEINRKNHL